MKIFVVLTCFNRRETTLEFLRCMGRQILPCGVDLGYVLVDDGCTDGTSEAVRKEFPGLEIVKGDGTLYWCGG